MERYILNFTESIPKPTYTWKSNWYNRYESPWSVFHKFMYVNEIGITDLFKLFGTEVIQNKKSNVWSQQDGDLFGLNAFDEQKLQNILGLKLKNNVIKDLDDIFSVFDTNNARQIFYYQPLRFCPTCIQTGYHSIFHQFKLFSICPLHQDKLISNCPNCGTGFANEYNLVRNDFTHGFRCRCGFSLIDKYMKRTFAKVWDSESFSIEKTELITKLLSIRNSDKAKRIHINNKIPLYDYKNPFDNLYNVLAPEGIDSNHTIIKSRKGINKIRNLDKKQFSKYSFRHQCNLPNLELYYSMEATYKSIARNIRKTILAKHKQCIKDLKRNTSNKGICPYVHAYAHWRGQIEDLNYYWHIHTYKNRRIKEQQIDFYSRVDSNYLYSVYQQFISAIFQERGESIYDTEPYILRFISEENLTTTKYIINRLFSYLLINYFINWLNIAKTKAEERIVYHSTPFKQYEGIPFYIMVYPTKENDAAEFHFWPEKNQLLSSIPRNLKCPNKH